MNTPYNVSLRLFRGAAIVPFSCLTLTVLAGSKLEALNRAATLMSLLGTCWANRVNPLEYLTDIIKVLPVTPADQLDSLLPHVWIGTHPEAALPPIK